MNDELGMEKVGGALFRLGLRFLCYSVMLGLLAAGMLQGAVTFGPEFYSELGPVEILESVFALLTALMFLLAARGDAQRVPCAVLLSGFLFCLVVRESDYHLDVLISRHAWKFGVVLILAFMGGYAWRFKKEILPSFYQFAVHPSSGIFLSGFLVLIVFSRLFGYSDFWEGLVLDEKWDCVRAMVKEHTHDIIYTLLMEEKCLTIKRIAEESAEQVGYFLMAIASFEYWHDARRTRRLQKEG